MTGVQVDTRAMRKIGAALALVVLVPLAVAVLLLARPSIEVLSSTDPDVTIRCDGSTSVSPDVCRDWGDQILAEGAPSMTFEMEDLARLEISRPMLGFAAECRASFFLQRYPNESTWEEEGECIGG